MAKVETFKLQSVTWDSDKNPKGLQKFMQTMGSVVRTTAHGGPLEDFLDYHLNRTKSKAHTVPKYFSNPEFDSDDDEDTTSEASAIGSFASAAEPEQQDPDVAAMLPDPRTPGGGLGSTPPSVVNLHIVPMYKDFTPETKTLDKLMYNMLVTNVTGSYASLLQCVGKPSYVQGITIMYRHDELSKNSRKTQAFAAMDALVMKGDVKIWKIKAINALRELFEAKCTILDFGMIAIMKSLSGKSKTMQYKVAEDINSNVASTTSNVFDMVERYASQMAAVGDDKPSPANLTDTKKKVCEYCKKEGHVKSECRKLKADQAAKDTKSQKVCDYCKKPGHTKAECRKFKFDQKNKESKPDAKANLNVNQGPLNADQIAEMMAKFQRGEPILMVKPALPEPTPPPPITLDHALINEMQAPELVRHRVCEPEAASIQGQAPSPALMAKAGKLKPDPSKTLNDGIWFSMCGGMDVAALIAKAIQIRPSRHISVEITRSARTVAAAIHQLSEDHPGVDHSFATDVPTITREQIKSLGKSAISMICFGAPCEDMSKLRLLPPRHAGDRKANPRPGLDGPKGQIFRECLKVRRWIKEFSPRAKTFIENVDFSDMEEHWAEIEEDTGMKPILIDSADYSNTRRRRAYWTDICLPAGFPGKAAPLDPDLCMDAGRKLIRQKQDGKEYVRTIGKSWKGDPDNPVADTKLPVLVNDGSKQEPQHLRPREAAKLMGLPAHITNAPGITAKMWLQCIGNGWDMNVVIRFFLAYRLELEGRTASKPEHSTLLASLLIMHKQMPASEFSALLAKQEPHMQQLSLKLLSDYFSVNARTSMLSNAGYKGSVLDSGSARHLQPQIMCTDPDAGIPMVGFNGETSWTQGQGYSAIEAENLLSGNQVKLDIDDVDQFPGVYHPIWSLGKLLRAGYSFHLADKGKDCYALTPDGSAKLTVELGPDDMLWLPHTQRSGKDAERLPDSRRPQQSPRWQSASRCPPLWHFPA